MSDNWTSPVQCRQQVQKLWDRGELLRSVIAAQTGVSEEEWRLFGYGISGETTIEKA